MCAGQLPCIPLKTQENLLVLFRVFHNFSTNLYNERNGSCKSKRIKQFNREAGKRMKQMLQKRYLSSL